jgi:hypothetical protein
LRKSNLYDWEKELIASYAKEFAGKAVKLVDVVTALDIQLNTKTKIKERNFRALEAKLKPLLKGKQIFKVGRSFIGTQRPVVVEFASSKDQPDDSFLDNFGEINENLDI